MSAIGTKRTSLVHRTCPLSGVKRTCRLHRKMSAYDAVDGASSAATRHVLPQCASKTGSVAAAITCWVAPPNIICLNQLWVKAPLIKRSQANV